MTRLAYSARARLADNLFVLRRRKGLSQETLGTLAWVGASAISRIEQGKGLPQLDTSVRIAGALGVSLDELLAGVAWRPGEFSSAFEPPAYEIESVGPDTPSGEIGGT